MAKRIKAKEFTELGLLQEVNRLLLHPMGLALEVVVEEDGSYRFGDIWDYMDDPEGLVFGDSTAESEAFKEKAERVNKMFEEKRAKREKNLGWHIQPVE